MGRLFLKKTTKIRLGKLLSYHVGNYATCFDNPDTHLAKVKTYASRLAGLVPDAGKGLVTPSPLDYQVFIQAIMANYQVYNPAKFLFPFELATNSFLLPSVMNTATDRVGGSGGVLFEGKGGGKNLGPMLNKVVHIAALAPWPPRSPSGVRGGGGRNGTINRITIIPSYIILPPLLM